MPYTREEHQKASRKIPRDTSGHFAHPGKPSSPQSPLNQFLSSHTHYSKNHDDILDVHVGNPLHRITVLLEEIKRQKAFSFTLKGSLGIMGVALALSIFGIFGGGKLLCDKGIQTQIGTIKTLRTVETEGSHIPVLSNLLSYLSNQSNLTPHPRTVLITQEGIIHIPYSPGVPLSPQLNQPLIITGQYDSCSKTLKIHDPASIEIYSSFPQ